MEIDENLIKIGLIWPNLTHIIRNELKLTKIWLKLGEIDQNLVWLAARNELKWIN